MTGARQNRRSMRRRSLSHALRRMTGSRLSVDGHGALAERMRDLAAEQQLAIGESDQSELLARLLPPSHLPPELVSVLCVILPSLLDEDARLADGQEGRR